MKKYQCQKCGTLITNQSRPNPYGCPSGGNHQWADLGECGTTRYQCKKCGTLINSKLRPNPYGCPSGGSHQWNQL